MRLIFADPKKNAMFRYVLRKYHAFRQWLSPLVVSRFKSGGVFNAFLAYESRLVSMKPDLMEFVDKRGHKFYACRSVLINTFKYGWDLRVKRLQGYYGVNALKFRDNSVVVDIGANIGEFGHYYLRHAGIKNTTLISFEPDPVEFVCLEKNNKDPRSFNCNKALWSKRETLTLYHKNEFGDTSLIKPPGHVSESSIDVSTLDHEIEVLNIFEKHECIDLIKIEAEGAEPEIISGGLNTIGKTRYVVVDCGPERGLRKETTVVSVVGQMIEMNFELINFIPGRYALLFKNTKLD